MDVFPKFIIEYDTELKQNVLIIAKCTYHKQLAFDINHVKSGGAWELDRENNIFTLYGRSDDFGAAELDDIIACVQNKHVYSSYAHHRNFTDNFAFRYKNSDGQIIDII